MTRTTYSRLLLGGALATALLMSACAGGDAPGAAGAPEPSDHSHEGDPTGSHDPAGSGEQAATENAARKPRIAATYDGGILVLDANTLERVADIEVAGFNRLSPVGDGRHVAVATTGGFAILDTGTWSQPHGDHSHYYTAEPELHDVILAATTPGHVVVHDGLTAFFDDGTGQATVVEVSEWADMVAHGHLHPIREYTAAAAHHGVAVATNEDTLLVTRGDENGRTGAMLLDADDAEIVVSDECPGVHGETAFTDAEGEELLVVGCEDGILAFHGDHVHKISSPDAYGRIGNQFAAEGSSVVLGDYKTDPEGDLSLVALVDTSTQTVTPIDPFAGSGANYTFRGLARGDDGEHLVLGTDGTLRVLDPTTGELTTTIEVIAPWELPQEWQEPQPALKVLDGMAYVSDPAAETIHIVDYAGGTVWKSVDVGAPINELATATG